LIGGTRVAYAPPPAGTGLLNPIDFPSLGANPFTANGTNTIDTAATPPVLTKPDFSTIGAGVTVMGLQLKHAGGAPSSVPGTAPIVAVISLKGNGLSIAKDADGNTTPNAAGCLMAVSLK